MCMASYYHDRPDSKERQVAGSTVVETLAARGSQIVGGICKSGWQEDNVRYLDLPGAHSGDERVFFFFFSICYPSFSFLIVGEKNGTLTHTNLFVHFHVAVAYQDSCSSSQHFEDELISVCCAMKRARFERNTAGPWLSMKMEGKQEKKWLRRWFLRKQKNVVESLSHFRCIHTQPALAKKVSSISLSLYSSFALFLLLALIR